jgi:hypothetical protein
MAVDFYIKQGDVLPVITTQCLDENGAAVNLTGASVRFLMRPQRQAAIKVNALASITTAAEGRAKYEWQSGDTDRAGTYEAEWEVTFADGKKSTFPNDGYNTIAVLTQIGSAP